MPRGDGNKSGHHRPNRVRYDTPQQIPRKLKARLYDFEASKEDFKPSEHDMLKRPGSQNPKKRGPRRTRGV